VAAGSATELPRDFAPVWEGLQTASSRILILDYDGTLAPFHAERDKAIPYAGVTPLLDSIIARRTCRVVVVSGRWTGDLLPLLGLRENPEVWDLCTSPQGYPDQLEDIIVGVEQLEPSIVRLITNSGLVRRLRSRPGVVRCSRSRLA